MEDLCCCFESYHDGGPEFMNQKIVKARKQHACSECGRTIEQGEKYEYSFGKWDGDTSEFKTCLGCMRLRDSMDCGDGYTFGILAVHVLDCLGTEIRVDPPMSFSRTLIDRTGNLL